ncbi:plant virulence effector HPE1-like domain-containing protein [Neorhizobium vignae]|uniref:plant virulence effector HPE1-like domain-containing protein n=1 Tax=Neorhizobium vignae TaxID=690585 RepID=UPI00068BCE28|nr:plant virulence effector HPE1-like domain-containing protein [Neorhizobium vignae]
MRLVLATALVFASSSAFASSITVINGTHQPGVSIVAKTCAGCPIAAAPKSDEAAYKVPDLPAGTQKTEIIEINGEKKLARTEAWLGGSPVIHVSKLPKWMAEDKAIAEVHPTTNGSTQTQIAAAEAPSDGIDTDAMTSAVKTIGEASVGIAEASLAPRALDLDLFVLRTNRF